MTPMTMAVPADFHLYDTKTLHPSHPVGVAQDLDTALRHLNSQNGAGSPLCTMALLHVQGLRAFLNLVLGSIPECLGWIREFMDHLAKKPGLLRIPLG
jgi:hypothetical protein